MNEENLIPAGQALPEMPPPNAAIIEMCEQLVVHAKSGALQAIVGVAFVVPAGPSGFRAITGLVEPVLMLGSMVLLQNDLAKNIADRVAAMQQPAAPNTH